MESNSRELEPMNNNSRRQQALLLENLRSNEREEFENIARQALLQESNNIVDVNFVYPPPLNKTLLDVACCEGRTNFAEILVKLGANVNKINDAHNRGPIHFAAEAGHEHILEILLGDNAAANPDLVGAGGQTALHMAVRKDQRECVRVLLENEAHPNIVNSKGVTPIHVAATMGLREMVRLILGASKFPLDIDGFRDFRKLTTRDILREKMPDLELPPPLASIINFDPSSPSNEENSESQFIENLKNINDDNDIEKFMRIAARRNFPEAIRELMNKSGGCGGGGGGGGEAAARIAVQLGHYHVLREILSIDCKIADKLLLSACQELGVATCSESSNDDRAKCLRLIMEQPSVNARCQDDKGNTPLHYAARAESTEAVDILLRSGSCIGHKNVCGIPPLAHVSPTSLSLFFDDCVQSENDRSDEFEIEFDYRCFMPLLYNDRIEPQLLQTTDNNDDNRNNDNNNNSRNNSEMSTLAFIAENDALKGLLKHPLLSSFLYLKWHRMRHVLYANFIFYLIFYILINSYVLSTNYYNTCGNNTSASIVNSTTMLSSCSPLSFLKSLASVALVLLTLRESFQLISSPRQYASSFENILEVAIIILGGWIIIVGAYPQIGAIVILLSAWELVILIGQHPRMSTGIEMFKTVSINFARFLFLYAFLILAFALAFFTLFKDSKDDTNFPDPGHSLFKTIIMLTGEFDANDIPFVSHPVLSHFIFILFVFLIAIVLFNLLNGLAVSDTRDILNKSELVALVSRAKLISYAESIALAFSARFRKFHFLSRRILLFPDYLPQKKIGVKPYRSNAIRIHGRSEKMKNCARFSMDPSIVEYARQVLSKRGHMTDNQKIIAQFDTIRDKLENLETMMDVMRLALANNNLRSTRLDKH